MTRTMKLSHVMVRSIITTQTWMFTTQDTVLAPLVSMLGYTLLLSYVPLLTM